MQMRTSFHMHSQMIRASFGESLEKSLRFFDHQMHIEWKFGHTFTSFHNEWSHSDIGYEVPIHYINVQPVRASGFAGGDLFTEACKICGENGWSKDVWVGHNKTYVTVTLKVTVTF